MRARLNLYLNYQRQFPFYFIFKPTLFLTDGITIAFKKFNKSSSRDWRKNRKKRINFFHADNDFSNSDSANNKDTALNYIKIS